MISWSQKVVKYLTVFGFFGLVTFAPEAQAQNAESVSKSEPARQNQVLQGLESRNISDWGFASGGESGALVDEDAEPYELNATQDVRLVEQDGDIEAWDNNGDDEDNAVLVEVYDF